jgi:hypothetical protein
MEAHMSTEAAANIAAARQARAAEAAQAAAERPPWPGDEPPADPAPAAEVVEHVTLSEAAPTRRVSDMMSENIEVIRAERIPEEREMVATAFLTQRHLAEQLRTLTSKQQFFLRMRATTDTDAAARHMAGRRRQPLEDGQPDMRPCDCSRRRQMAGWVDVGENTLFRWKDQEAFMFCYRALLEEPLLYSVTRLEQLVPTAVQRMSEIMDGMHDAKASDIRQVSTKILEANGLLVGDGNRKSSSAVEDTMNRRIARARAERNLPMTAGQKQLLADPGEMPRPNAPSPRVLD